jgi:dTDP-glucose 4,6-dehydratase
MTHGRRGETYNIGGRCEKSNMDVVLAICELVDREENNGTLFSCRDLIEYVTDRPGHDHRYAIDDTKLRNELGFEPSEIFETGLQKTANWYRLNASWLEEIQRNEHQKNWQRQNYEQRGS